MTSLSKKTEALQVTLFSELVTHDVSNLCLVDIKHVLV